MHRKPVVDLVCELLHDYDDDKQQFSVILLGA
jgi:hypothetical protein